MHVGQNILTQKLKATLDQRRRDGRLLVPPVPVTLADTIDFGSNDTLNLSGSGLLSAAFLRELERHPGFTIGSTSARAFEGTRKYLIDLEDDLAKFHGAEAGVFVNSGFDGNVAIWSAIPQPGDFIVYDELAHASIHDGMRMGRATCLPFRHNDPEALKARLEEIRDNNASVASGESLVFISVESFYSMDGDAAPIHGIVAAAREALPSGNYLCAIDEAHSNGLVGPNGSGFVCHFGLEKEFPIRLNTCGKALGSTGAIILCNETIKSALINYARNMVFSTAPSFLCAAGVRAGYELAASAEGEKRRQLVQQKVRYFYRLLTDNPKWRQASRCGIVRLPTEKTWATRPLQSPIIALIAPMVEADSLAEHLRMGKYWVNVVHFPTVPRGMDRVRMVIHAHNTKEEIEAVVGRILGWATEKMESQSLRVGL
ncbi:aminotransferase [Aspergillus steynii IBT 23096]|uniref:Aminotransferase n=1 Tax=Aspergillus steynii IBT 23096 TaxID=1392250 RepID=A0A2I2G9W5_9EURO|nr:aminotransferase [Aspergillus steynii IBT 23096]PLB49643.1 aminotransferase [Aspergillus steynii IBT 23096]